jgi:hypothetical protein
VLRFATAVVIDRLGPAGTDAVNFGAETAAATWADRDRRP